LLVSFFCPLTVQYRCKQIQRMHNKQKIEEGIH
jgi:hypothetical protein